MFRLSRITCVVQKKIGCTISVNSFSTIGFIGLGHMGSKMVANIINDGHNVIVFDANKATANAMVGENIQVAAKIEDMTKECETVISMLPNDKAVNAVSAAIMKKRGICKTHIGCSTVSPTTSRKLAEEYKKANMQFIAAPVFARPDGLARRQAVWMIAGEDEGRKLAATLLESSGRIVDYGEDTGSANVVKLCGNFLIASSIEAIAESMALAEKHGVDRKEVMNLLSSSIFDCLIYKGYGQRVSERDHRPGGFSLELGLKDVSLVSAAAREVDTPMPFLSVLLDRFVSAKARGRGKLDWSAAGLSVAEDAGIDVSADVKRNKKAVKDGNFYE